MKSQRPIFSKLTAEGSAILYNATGDEIGTVKDPQDADDIVAMVNKEGRYTTGDGRVVW